MQYVRNGEYPGVDGPFEPTWSSLANYACPDWFRNAKLGMWAHWGPQAVSTAGDWYARRIYEEGSDAYDFHVKHYGHPSEFGYKDIVKLWKAEKFNPEELIGLYSRAGARYFTAMAVHHDNYDCWNSTYHRWNSVNVGPEKDIVGLWRDAAREAGLRFGVTEHLERSYSWFTTNKGADSSGPRKGIPYDGNDPLYADFYFPKHDDANYAYPKNPPEWWKWQWFARISDLLQQHEPDLLYTDGGVPFGEVGRRLLANFYNANIARHGRLEAVYALKDLREHDKKDGSSTGDYVDGIGVLDMEKGVVDGIRSSPWQTDTCIGGWYYNQFIEYKSTRCVVQLLTDIVSKNGNLLLNLPLRADGTLDEESISVVNGLGEWMSVNQEAIYDSRPWTQFGEGPTKSEAGIFNEAELPYTASDFRFTQKGDTLYATMLGWPENGKTVISSITPDEGKVVAVKMLGAAGRPAWSQDDRGLTVTVPTQKPCDHAWVFRINLE